MTDHAIAVQVLKKIGLDEDIIYSRLDDCLGEIVKYFLENVKRDKIPILPGVMVMLESLTVNGALIGLVAGNLELIAWGKLKSIGIDYYFKLGSFGSDSTDRTELVKMVIKKAECNFKFNGTTFVMETHLKI